MIKSCYTVENWISRAQDAALFLDERYESSLFLLGNLESFGATVGESPNSGNYRVVLRDGAIAGVFCLTKRGNLLLQGNADADLVSAVCESVQREPYKIAGVLGPWPLASAVWHQLEQHGQVNPAQVFSREILYRFHVSDKKLSLSASVRLLTREDWEEWRPLRLAYLEEVGMRQDLSDDEFKDSFYRLVAQQLIWGAFSPDVKLLSVAGLNAKAKDIGQVGPVYTTPAARCGGLARMVMHHLIHDAQSIHKIKKLILFTEKNNIAAQCLYESLGFERSGHFGLILS